MGRAPFTFAFMLMLAGAMRAPLPRQTVSVVVSSRSPLRDITSTQLRKYLLAQTTRLPNHHRLILCFPPSASLEGTIVLDRFLHLSVIDFSQTWIGAVFRGDASNGPLVLPSRDAMAAAVAANPDALGFVLTAGSPLSQVRIVRVDGHDPDDGVYPLGR